MYRFFKIFPRLQAIHLVPCIYATVLVRYSVRRDDCFFQIRYCISTGGDSSGSWWHLPAPPLNHHDFVNYDATNRLQSGKVSCFPVLYISVQSLLGASIIKSSLFTPSNITRTTPLPPENCKLSHPQTPSPKRRLPLLLLLFIIIPNNTKENLL